MKLENFNDVQHAIASKRRPFNLLLGNGFSMAYDKGIFSYNALFDFIESLDDEILSKIFSVVKTKNFELIMSQLKTFSALLDAFDSDNALKVTVESSIVKIKKSLIDAVKSLHPEHVFKIPQDATDSCAQFLQNFLGTGGKIFTTNYDLLLYWVLMRSKVLQHCDGFGRDRLDSEENVSEEDMEWSELRWGKYREQQNVFYLHGALPFFDTGIEIEKEEYDSENYLLENISARMDADEYPIFVTAGDGNEKLANIMHNRYLTHCYEQFSKLEGSLVTFGFNFGEYDKHIIDAINIAAKHGRNQPPKLWSIYIGVFSQEDKAYIESIKDAFSCKVHIFDSSSINIWGN